MLVLAIDTSTPNVTVAIAEVGEQVRVLAHRDQVTQNRHGELLAPAVAEVLAAAAIDRADVSAVGVGLGPGPFTGLRVGVATGAAMADALGIPAYGVCSLDVLAAAHRSPDGRDLLVLTDARRKQVYWARYDGGGVRVDGPDIATPDDLLARHSDGRPVACGAGAVHYAAELEGLDVDDGEPFPRADILLRCVADRVLSRAPAERLEPMYLRRPDARPPGPPKRVTA